MKSCSSPSSKHSSDSDQNKNPSSHFLVLPLCSPPFNFIHSTPFFRQLLSSSRSNVPSLMEASNAVHEVQKTIFCNVDKCLKRLDKLRSHNVILDKVMSFCSHLQKGCQIQRINCRSPVMMSSPNFAAILPGDSVAGVVVANGILNFLSIYNTLLVVRLVLTWFPNAPPAVVSPLSTLCDPYLNIFRGIIPPLGGTLDLSPILAFLVLNAFTSTAAALPAELPSTEVSKANIPSHSTASQKKWMRRLSGNKSNRFNSEV